MSSIKLKGSSSGEATITTASDGSTVNVDKNLVLPAGQNFCIGATDDVVIGRATDDRMTFNTGGTERARIDENGKVGIGTSSPAHMLHVKASDSRVRTEESSGSTTFDLTNTSSGHFLDSSGTNDLTINKSGSANLVLKTANTERMRIDPNGHLCLGRTGFSFDNTSGFAVAGSGSNEGQLHCSTAGQECMKLNRKDSNGNGLVFARGSTNVVGTINFGSSSVTYNTSSDYRLKENIDYSWDATTRLKQLKPARFNWIVDDTNTLVDGFIAHEVSSIVPEAITGSKDATRDLGTITETLSNVIRNSSGNIIAQNVSESDWTAGKVAEPQLYPSDSTWKNSYDNVVTENAVESDKEDGQTWEKTSTENVYQGIDQSKLVPLLVKTIQEQQAVIEDLQSRVTTLEG